MDTSELRRVHLEAARGARSVTAKDSVVLEAADAALERFEDVVLRGRHVHSLSAWSHEAGKREALRLMRAHPPLRSLDPDRAMVIPSTPGDPTPVPADRPSWTAVRARLLRDHSLTDRQRDVLKKLDPRLSIKGNCRQLGVDPSSLRRMLRSIGARVRGLVR